VIQLSGAPVPQHPPAFRNPRAPQRHGEPPASIQDPATPGIEARGAVIDELAQFLDTAVPALSSAALSSHMRCGGSCRNNTNTLAGRR
jgi:hypothetical protein